MIEFLLASASPRRKEILENLGINFSLLNAPDFDEDEYLANSSLSPEDTALQLAEKKSLALKLSDSELALTADTIVAIDNLTLGKPKNDNEAYQFLKKLSGKKHRVITAIALRKGTDQPSLTYESTDVVFKSMSDNEINWYISTGEPFGKAGGYAIQGFGSIFIMGINGCYFNVVGLPVFRLFEMFSNYGINFQDLIRSNGGNI